MNRSLGKVAKDDELRKQSVGLVRPERLGERASGILDLLRLAFARDIETDALKLGRAAKLRARVLAGCRGLEAAVADEDEVEEDIIKELQRNGTLDLLAGELEVGVEAKEDVLSAPFGEEKQESTRSTVKGKDSTMKKKKLKNEKKDEEEPRTYPKSITHSGEMSKKGSWAWHSRHYALDSADMTLFSFHSEEEGKESLGDPRSTAESRRRARKNKFIDLATVVSVKSSRDDRTRRRVVQLVSPSKSWNLSGVTTDFEALYDAMCNLVSSSNARLRRLFEDGEFGLSSEYVDVERMSDAAKEGLSLLERERYDPESLTFSERKRARKMRNWLEREGGKEEEEEEDGDDDKSEDDKASEWNEDDLEEKAELGRVKTIVYQGFMEIRSAGSLAPATRTYGIVDDEGIIRFFESALAAKTYIATPRSPASQDLLQGSLDLCSVISVHNLGDGEGGTIEIETPTRTLIVRPKLFSSFFSPLSSLVAALQRAMGSLFGDAALQRGDPSRLRKVEIGAAPLGAMALLERCAGTGRDEQVSDAQASAARRLREKIVGGVGVGLWSDGAQDVAGRVAGYVSLVR